ncbi:MAG: right-handed parallel beta-helix repeat-containing protein [Candidatus Eisenbacteria sp.]|nr:right-handed parallel beta-helix repeat-containing protein [Candidatus Eisenbacteria bacterium]
MRLAIAVFLLASFLTISAPALAASWNVPSQCPTIQAGIDSASAGDTVLVACGTYHEYDIVMKPGVLLRSETGEADCATIHAQQQGRIFYCKCLDVTPGIEGFTITGGYATGEYPDCCGAGMYCEASSPLIVNCTFSGNSAQGMGGGIYCRQYASPTLIGCTFSGNSAGGAGGMYCENGSSPALTNCTFADNLADCGGALSCIWGGLPAFTNCTFSGNSAADGGAVECWGSSPVFTGCVFSGNSAYGWGGGAMGLHKFSNPTITGCTFCGNSGPEGGVILCDIYCDPALENTIIAFSTEGEAICCLGGSSPTLSCCDVYGNEGGNWTGCIAGQHGVDGNFSECPLFCDSQNGDFHLQNCSPCAVGNHPDGCDCGLIGAYDVGCECGLPTAVEQASWSSLKTLYR